jgi:hypothetical protein
MSEMETNIKEKQNSFFEKINKIKELLARLAKKKRIHK